MKRLIILADGTWGSPNSRSPSNVLRLARACAQRQGKIEQVVFYDWGIASESAMGTEALSGKGIDKNIQDCYRFLVHNYTPGDELFFFGFSRGAYTVRSLCGLIRNSGLLLSIHAKRIQEAYSLYRLRGKSAAPRSSKAAKFRASYCHADRTQIHFLGVWDTVGALGIPVPFWGNLGKRHFLFHDTALSSSVTHARHGPALDERREDFEPCLWQEKPCVDSKQVWFSGAHGDIGGGIESGFADTSLAWLAREAKACGLELTHEAAITRLIDQSARGQHAQPANLRNSARGLFALRPKASRQIRGAIHRSAVTRYQQDIDSYRRRAQALKTLLASVDGEWNRLAIEE